MVRLFVGFSAILILSACAKSSDFERTQATAPSMGERPPSSIDNSTDPGSNVSEAEPQQLQLHLLPGASLLSGAQISGYVSISNNITRVHGGGIYGEVEMNNIQK